MSDFIVRVFQVQLLNGSADVSMTGDTPDQVANIVLTAVGDDPDDESGDRRYHLPDGRFVLLDPEDCVVGGRIYCQVLDDERHIVGFYGDLTSCDFNEGAPDAETEHGLLTPDEDAAVRAVLNDAITGTGSNRKAALLTAALRKLPRAG